MLRGSTRKQHCVLRGSTRRLDSNRNRQNLRHGPFAHAEHVLAANSSQINESVLVPDHFILLLITRFVKSAALKAAYKAGDTYRARLFRNADTSGVIRFCVV